MKNTKRKNIKWTDTKLKEEALKYKTRGEFQKKSTSAYQVSFKRGILDDICSHMENVLISWTDKKLKEESLKYKTRSEFQKKSTNAYSIAYRKGILDDICSHMENVLISWTHDMLKEEALKYKTRSEFQKKSANAYHASLRKGILDDICSHMENVLISWTHDMLKEEALKYKTRSEFFKKSTSAYQTSIKRGILDDICGHMPKRSQFGKIEDYRDRKTILYYIKVNEYWKIGIAIHEQYNNPEDTILKQRYGFDIKNGDVDIAIIDYKIYEDGYEAAYNEAEIKEMYVEDLYTGERILGCNKDGIITEDQKRLKETEIFDRDIYNDISYYFNEVSNDFEKSEFDLDEW